MNEKIEIWEDITGYEGLYQVSDLGNIKSLSKEVSNRNGVFVKKDKVLKKYQDKDGYNTVNLYKNKEKKLYKVYRIVATQLIPNPENKPTVNHINSIRSDDRKVNLEWNTYSENNKHAFDFGFQKPMRGDKCWIYNINPDLHPTSKEVIDLSNGKTYGSLKSACLDLKIKYSSMLSKISLNGKGKNDTSLMYLSELEELPNNIIIKIGNKEFNFNSEYQSKWIKIESEKDLPKEKGLKCLFLCVHGNTTYISDDVLEDPKWFVNKYSHWRLKDEIKDPILKVQNSK